MPLKQFKYTKQPSGEVSNRVVYPLHLVDDKLLSIDVSNMTDEERLDVQVVLDAIHKQYIQSINDAGLGSNFRSFFLDQMS